MGSAALSLPMAAEATTEPRVVIVGTSYVDGQERRWLADQWLRLVRHFNPGCDVGVFDTASGAVDWRPSGVQWRHRFEDNIGHLSKTGRDGWGRAFAAALDTTIAWNSHYDYVVHIECDLLFARPVMPIIERMRRCGLKALSTVATPYQFMETGLMFLDAAYARDTRLVERYDWQNPPADRLPEHRIEALLGDDLYLLPLRGRRCDGGLRPGYMALTFPFGCDWLTHASVACYRKFLEMNGVADE